MAVTTLPMVVIIVGTADGSLQAINGSRLQWLVVVKMAATADGGRGGRGGGGGFSSGWALQDPNLSTQAKEEGVFSRQTFPRKVLNLPRLVEGTVHAPT